MRKRVVIYLFILTFAGFLLLYFYQLQKKRDAYDGGFQRKLVLTEVNLLKVYPLPANWYFKLSALPKDSLIYLIPARKPMYGVVTEKDITQHWIKAPGGIKLSFQDLFLAGGNLLLADGEDNLLYTLNKADSVTGTRPLGLAMNTALLNDSSYVERTANYFKDSCYFTTQPLTNEKQAARPRTNFMLKGKDGGLDEDGYFAGDSSYLFYIPWFANYFYRLHLANGAVTGYTLVPTILPRSFFPEVKVFGQKSKTYVYAGQVKNVNLHAVLHNGLLLVQSNIKDNAMRGESLANWFILDCYNAAGGQYRQSLLLRHGQGQHALSFAIEKNRLYLLFSNRLCVYAIDNALNN
jgi:hypothetical protein